jgi:hypothetical protein
MSPDRIVQWLRNDLEPWCHKRRGHVSIAGDPGNLLDLLAEQPHGFRVIIAWAGDDDQTGMEEAGIVENHVEVWLCKAKGLKMTPGESLVKGTERDPAFLLLLSDLRVRLRSLAFPHDETTYGRMLYKGCKPYPNAEMAFELNSTGFCLRFDLTGAVPFIGLRGQANAER